MSVIIVLYLFATILRSIVFHKREEKWYKGFIPFYNKYTLGKLCDQKILGIITAVLNFLVVAIFTTLVILEYHIIMSMPAVIEDINNFDIYQYVTKFEIDFNNVLQVVIGVIAALYIVFWTWLSYKFIKKNGDPVWWLLVWIIVPDLGYLYSCTHNTVYIPGTGMVKYKKVVIDEQST